MSGPRRSERGSSTLPTILACGVLFIFLTLLTQFVAWQYGRGVLRAATLDAARAATPLDARPGACVAAFDRTRAGLLGGGMGSGVGRPSCVIEDELVVVTVDAHFERWLPFSPDWNMTVSATAVRERSP